MPRLGHARALDIQQLYEEHAEFVHVVIARMLGPSGPDPADLLHETFIVAMKKFHKARVESPRAWLCDVAVKLAVAARRNARIRQMLGMQLPRVTETRRTPEDIAENREEFEAIYAALDNVATPKRTVFILFEIQGFSGEEIADLLRIPMSTVYTRLFHARREFTKHFAALQRSRSGARESDRG